MLVLSRKPGESFIAGECVKITVLEVSGDRIKIGIEAPPSVRIMRTEVAEPKKQYGGGQVGRHGRYGYIQRQAAGCRSRRPRQAAGLIYRAQASEVFRQAGAVLFLRGLFGGFGAIGGGAAEGLVFLKEKLKSFRARTIYSLRAKALKS